MWEYQVWIITRSYGTVSLKLDVNFYSGPLLTEEEFKEKLQELKKRLTEEGWEIDYELPYQLRFKRMAK
jgi:hypothetical protein